MPSVAKGSGKLGNKTSKLGKALYNKYVDLRNGKIVAESRQHFELTQIVRFVQHRFGIAIQIPIVFCHVRFVLSAFFNRNEHVELSDMSVFA